MFYTLDVSVQMLEGHMGEWTQINKDLKRLVGSDPHSSGTGFGARDSQWDFTTKSEAEAAEKKLKQFFGPRLHSWVEVNH